jgi:hypothetical protein
LGVGICDRDDRACVDGDGEHRGLGGTKVADIGRRVLSLAPETSPRCGRGLGTPCVAAAGEWSEAPACTQRTGACFHAALGGWGAGGGAALLDPYIGRRGVFAREWTTTNSPSLTSSSRGQRGVERARYRRSQSRQNGWRVPVPGTGSGKLQTFN